MIKSEEKEEKVWEIMGAKNLGGKPFLWTSNVDVLMKTTVREYYFLL